MKWQQDGELSPADLDALINTLKRVECDQNRAELGRLGQTRLIDRPIPLVIPGEFEALPSQRHSRCRYW